jgi:hypothetical protein
MSHTPADALVLVAVINNPRDLEIARVLGWYRVPLKTAPRVVQVDYLAFYQTANFGKHKWCIEYTAAVRGHELVTRADLLNEAADHPRAKDLYYKIQLGPLQPLQEPIRAENWKRITFFYTLGEQLNNARTISDLVIDSAARKHLWQALRDRAAQSGVYDAAAEPDFDIDPELFGLLLAAAGKKSGQQESDDP